MKNAIFIVLILGFAAYGVMQSRQAGELRAENESLKGRLVAAEKAVGEERDKIKARYQAENDRLRDQLGEVHKLRGDVTRLRAQSEEAARLKAANEKLQASNARIRQTADEAAAAAAAMVQDAAPADGANFPKESWSFAGYDTPENALVSAIWAMQQGTPETYLNSLAPAEQERLAKQWAGKTEEEIAVKHQGDVAPISGIRVLQQEAVGADSMVMSVYIDGVDRMEKVSMQRVNNEWKFGGYIREPAR